MKKLAKKSDPQLLHILFEAVRASVGIVVSSDNPKGLRQKLYGVQKTDDDFRELQFILSPFNPDTELWITKNVKWQAKRDE